MDSVTAGRALPAADLVLVADGARRTAAVNVQHRRVPLERASKRPFKRRIRVIERDRIKGRQPRPVKASLANSAPKMLHRTVRILESTLRRSSARMKEWRPERS